MTSASARPQGGHENSTVDPIGQIHRFGEAATSVATTGRAYMDVMGKCQGEWCEFMTRRLSSDMNHGQTLVQCKDWREAAAVQQEWARQTIEDYVNEGRKLLQLAASASAVGVGSILAPPQTGGRQRKH